MSTPQTCPPQTRSQPTSERLRLLLAAAAPSIGLLTLALLPGPVGTVLCLLLVGAGLAIVVTQITTDDAGGSVTLMTGGYCMLALLIAGVQAVA